MKTWELVLIVLGAVLATICVFVAGAWYGQIGRYDECRYWQQTNIYICPSENHPDPQPVTEGDPA